MFPQNPEGAVDHFRPDGADLTELGTKEDLPETSSEAEAEVDRLRQSVPPPAAEWLRAARAMIAWLEERCGRAELDPLDQVTLARTWAAFSLGGSSEPQILRVAHLISRAHQAIRESSRTATELQAAILDCARVLHAGLPTAVRNRMPIERTVQVVRRLRVEADAWSAVVDGTSELLGWKDYARSHAASVIRIVIDRSR